MKKYILLFVLAALFLPVNAQAWFRFYNNTSTTIWVAFQWYSPNCDYTAFYETKGWWKLYPGQTKTVFGADLQSVNNPFFYYYAQASDGTTWSGPFTTCTPNTAFDWCLNDCNNELGTKKRGFREKYINDYNNYTLSLVK